MHITVETENIIKVSNTILDKAVEFQSEIDKFLNIVEKVDAAWDGLNANYYVTNLKEKYVIELNELKKILDEYGSYLKHVPESYQVLDEIFSSKNIDV